MDFSEVFKETKQARFTLGLARFRQNGEEGIIAPYCSIKLGEEQGPLSDKMAHNSKLFIEIAPGKNGTYNYIFHGDCLRAGVVIDNSNGKEVASEIFFDFSASIQVDKKSHQIFQTEIGRMGFWILRIQTSVDTYLIINSRTDEIKDIIEVASMIPSGTFVN